MGPWRLADLDLDRPLAPIALGPDEDGAGLTLWWRGRPVAFLLHATARGAVLSADALADLVTREAGPLLVEAAIRERLTVPSAAGDGPATLTIAICTRDRPALLARLLASLAALEPADGPSPRTDILVVDNAPSDDATRRLVAGHAGVRYELEPCPGLDFARNRAVAAAAGEVIAFLDDDVTVDPLWLRRLVEAIRQNPDFGALTGQVLPLALETPAQVLFERRGGFRHGFRTARWGRECGETAGFHPCHAGCFGAGANMAFPTALLRQLGGFDEALDTGPPLPGGGDLDIFYRVIRAGWPLVYEPAMLVRHEHRRELAQLRRQYWSWGLGFMAFLAKCHRCDPAWRPQQRRMILWWFKNEAKELWASVRGRHVLPPSFLLAELWGAVSGLVGGYARSRRRVARLKEAVA